MHRVTKSQALSFLLQMIYKEKIVDENIDMEYCSLKPYMGAKNKSLEENKKRNLQVIRYLH